jgi:hypothetical protein
MGLPMTSDRKLATAGQTHKNYENVLGLPTLSYFAEQLRLIVGDMALVHKKLIQNPALPGISLIIFKDITMPWDPKESHSIGNREILQ